MGTSTIEKGGWLIAVTGIKQTIAVIVNTYTSCTIYQGDNDMHDNNNSSTSNIVDNDSNCLRDSSDSNESFSFLNGTSTHGDSKVFFNGLNRRKFYYYSS